MGPRFIVSRAGDGGTPESGTAFQPNLPLGAENTKLTVGYLSTDTTQVGIEVDAATDQAVLDDIASGATIMGDQEAWPDSVFSDP